MLKEKNPYKMEPDLNAMVEDIQQGIIEEWIWRKIIEKLYDQED